MPSFTFWVILMKKIKIFKRIRYFKSLLKQTTRIRSRFQKRKLRFKYTENP